MKPQWQQQEQMRQRQEQLRRQQEMGAWLQKQAARARPPRPAEASSRTVDRFAHVEGQVARLRQELGAGRLTEEQFKAQLRELMVQDAQGTWWMVGAETGGWYRHDGTNWVADQPPGHIAAVPVSLPPTQSVERAHVGWSFWFLWVLANAVGGAAGEALVAPVGLAMFGLVGWAAFKIVFGASVGIMQWFVLRRQFYRAGSWVWTSTVGGAVGGAVAFAVGDVVGWDVFGIVFGVSVGMMQWLVLRRQIYRAGWLMLASIVGGIVGGVVGPAVSVGVFGTVFGEVDPAMFEIVFGAVSGAGFATVSGTITGIPLVWLLRHPASEAVSGSAAL